MTRKGDWIQTFTGGQFWPLDPRPEDFDIRDIANALSKQCRFGGHCEKFYSVAEHSYWVSFLVPYELRMTALLHDAAEAYLVDVPRPVKAFLPEYKSIEEGINVALAERFKLVDPWPSEIKIADEKMLAIEAKALMKRPPAPWVRLPASSEAECKACAPQCWSWSDAAAKFIERFRSLGG